MRESQNFRNLQARVYFEQEFASWTKGERAQAVAPVLNKTRELLRSPFLRSLVCAESNTLDLRCLWREQRLIVVRLDRSALGEAAMRVLSGLLTHLLFPTALRAKGDRKVMLCIDELPVLERYVGDALEDILAVARSMGLRLLAACQHMAQISGGLRSSLLANSAVKLFFRLGHEDARIVSSHLSVGTEPALVRATVTTDAVDRYTGLPELAQWKTPVLDAGGHRLRVDPGLAEALTWRDMLGADVRQDLAFVSRLAGTQRLYVQDPLTGNPTPLSEYLSGVRGDEFWVETKHGLEIVCVFPRPRISSASKTSEADAAKTWWRALAELPVQHAVLQAAGEPGRLIRLRDMEIPHVPRPRHDAFERVSVKVYGQTEGEIAKVLTVREREVKLVAGGRGGTAPKPAGMPARVRNRRGSARSQRMKASSNLVAERPRRRRHARAPSTRPESLTPVRLGLLRAVGDLGIATLPQLAALAAPSQASARRHLRTLFDGGWLEVVPTSRVTFAAPGERQDLSLLFGSAPNLYILTGPGERVLTKLDGAKPHRRDIRGLASTPFLAHELAIKDVRVWLELTARASDGQVLETWCDGEEAAFDLGRTNPPKVLRPDAWFVYRLGARVMVGLLEVDMATERGSRRWREKLEGYAHLFAGGRLKAVTGYANARVLVIAPSAKRRDQVAALVAEHARLEVAPRFWLAERVVLTHKDFTAPLWRQGGSDALRPLIPATVLAPNTEGGAK